MGQIGKRWRRRAIHVFSDVIKPIKPEEYAHLNTSDLAEITRKMIQKEITYHLRPLDHKIMSEAKEKNYRFNQII